MARHATTGPSTSESVITRHVVRVLISAFRASTVRPLSADTTDPAVFKPTLVHRKPRSSPLQARDVQAFATFEREMYLQSGKYIMGR